MALTKEQRDALPAEDFAVPGKRALPIHDAVHIRMAWNMVDRTQGLTEAERQEARERILSRAKEKGIDTAEWHKVEASLSMEAMAINLPEVADHPNRLPFSGILTRLDQPSDKPVGGAQGHKVLIPAAVAEGALPSLLGMAVDFAPNLDRHDKKSKIGLITEAKIEGDAIHIAGFFYAADYPEEVARLQAEKEKLGFSYEGQFRVQSLEAEPWVITSCVFTGAAVLYKADAAYSTTSLAATAEKEIDMNPEDLKKLLAEAVAPLADQVKTLTTDMAALKAGAADKGLEASDAVKAMVKPHADALRAAADKMDAAGVGTHSKHGHVAVLRRMADRMEAEAALGRLPHIFRDHDYIEGAAAAEKTDDKAVAALAAQIESMSTQIKDLSAKAFTNADGPERKTISVEASALLKKYGLGDTEPGKLTVETVDKTLDAMGVKGRAATEAKLKLVAAGALSMTAA